MKVASVTVARVFENGWRVALVGAAARKFTPAVVLQSSRLGVTKFPNSEARHFQPVPGYPIRRAVRHFKSAARSFGITAAARQFLKQAEACAKQHQE